MIFMKERREDAILEILVHYAVQIVLIVSHTFQNAEHKNI
jgi:hypothetical protein